ncbi:DUF2177 family protein [uncultured Acetobacterium sp.]|uniref:DUF2177 family protein n=1 Tax=uncultured Acetobacterium sp. TaxID=217139 RepID=UPI0025D8CE84|nr:DUF2177 family protein [uncultured Acetobacterium sp.]
MMESLFTLANFKHYFIALAVFLVIDMVWLLVIAKNTYSKYLGYLMAPNPNLWAALLFYLIFILGLLFFVIDHALTKASWQFALFAGMFFGLVTYSTYDLTNMATIKDWPAFITVIDLIWGSAVSGATAIISYFLIKLVG